MNYGYARCSTNETKQDINRQVRELKAAGAEKIFLEYEHGDSNELIEEVFRAIRDLRMMFSKHPAAVSVIIPEQLKDEENIVIY